METYKDLCDYLEGIYVEHRDLKPSQQRYPESVLIDEQKELPIDQFMNAFYDATGQEPERDIFFVENLIQKEEHGGHVIGLHPALDVPIGPAFLALLGSASIVKKFNLAAHYSSGVRYIVANLTNNVDYLEMLSYDRCPLVRCQVALNPKSPAWMKERLKGDNEPLVAEAALGNLDDLGFFFATNALRSTLSSCPCQEYVTEEDLENFVESKGLEVPFVATHLALRLVKFHDWHWATQPTPIPMQDYSLGDTVEYLKGPVHDQYSFSHAGHGINSYSLNFRHVSGDLAMIVQSGWGGVYGDSEQDTASWNDLVLRITTLLSSTATVSHDLRARKYLLVSSRFRMENEVELWKREGSEWNILEEVTTWEAVRDFLQAEYDPEALLE